MKSFSDHKRIFLSLFLGILIGISSLRAQSYSDSLYNANYDRFYSSLINGKYEDAEVVLKELISVLLKGPDVKSERLALLYGNLGIVYRNTFRYKEAFEVYEKAIDLYKLRDPNSLNLARTLNNISIVYELENEYNKALRTLKQSLSIIQKNQFDKGNSKNAVLARIAYIYALQNNREETLYYLDQAKKAGFSSTNDENIFYLKAINSCEILALDSLKSFYYKKRLNLIDNDDLSPLFKIDILIDHGYEILTTENLVDSAYQSYESAYNFAKKYYNEDHLVFYNISLSFVDYHIRKKDYYIALEKIQNTLSRYSKNFSPISPLENPNIDNLFELNMSIYPLRLKMTCLVNLYEQTKNPKYLLHGFETAELLAKITNKLKWRYDYGNREFIISSREINSLKLGQSIAHSLYKETGDKTYLESAFRLNEQGRAVKLLSSLRTQEAMKFGGITDQLLENEKKLNSNIQAYKELINNEKQFENPNESKIQYWDSIVIKSEQEYEDLIELFERQYPNYYNLKYNTDVISMEETSQKLGEDDMILSYTLMDSLMYIYQISSEGYDITETRVDTSLRRECMEFYDVITKQSFSYNARETFRNYSRLGYSLYQKLLEPVKDKITGKNLIIIPDGEIAYVPFEALLSAPVEMKERPSYYDLPYMILENGFSNSYSATIHFTQPVKNKNPIREILAFAPSYSNISSQNINPQMLRQDDREQLIRIPGVKEEVKRISSMLRADVFQDLMASESNFKSNVSDYRILHLAMHTILDDNNPLNSKLAFTQFADSTDDNFLHTYEIYNLGINADLAVLSSCSSGFGNLQEGEGIQSLARGFAYAGCPSILMTLWEVADNSTVEIMERFYYYLGKGYSKSEALHRSKIEFISRADLLKSNPFFWSSYVIMGDTAPVYSGHLKTHMMNSVLLAIPLLGLFFLYRRYRKSTLGELKLKD